MGTKRERSIRRELESAAKGAELATDRAGQIVSSPPGFRWWRLRQFLPDLCPAAAVHPLSKVLECPGEPAAHLGQRILARRGQCFVSYGRVRTLPERHDLIGQRIGDIEGIDAEKCGGAAELPFLSFERIDRRPFAVEGFRRHAVAPEPFQHRFDEIPELRFQLLPLDARFTLVYELDPGVFRPVPTPPETYPLLRRNHGQARKDETVAGERQVVPELEAGFLLSRALDLVKEMPPVGDQPFRNGEQGNDDVPPQGAARTVEHRGDGGAVRLDGQRGHRVTSEFVR